MIFEWDEAKRTTNLEKHGVDFVDASDMWTRPMLVAEDVRREYGESRYIGMGYVQDRLMVVVYTHRTANVVRIISLRKANSREVRIYGKATDD